MSMLKADVKTEVRSAVPCPWVPHLCMDTAPMTLFLTSHHSDPGLVEPLPQTEISVGEICTLSPTTLTQE